MMPRRFSPHCGTWKLGHWSTSPPVLTVVHESVWRLGELSAIFYVKVGSVSSPVEYRKIEIFRALPLDFSALFPRPLVSGSHLLGVSGRLRTAKIIFSWETASGDVSVCSSMLGSTACTADASVTEAFAEFHSFPCGDGLDLGS